MIEHSNLVNAFLKQVKADPPLLERISKRLALYAHKVLQSTGHRSPSYIESRDAFGLAINEFLNPSFEKNWDDIDRHDLDPERLEATVSRKLAWFVKRKIRNAASRKEQQLSISATIQDSSIEDSSYSTVDLRRLEGGVLLADHNLDREDILRLFKEDKHAHDIAELIMTECRPIAPREIATTLDLPITVVNNAYKRMRRILKDKSNN